MLHTLKVGSSRAVYDTESRAVLHLDELSSEMLEYLPPMLPLVPVCPVALRYSLAKYESTAVTAAYSAFYKAYSDGLLFAPVRSPNSLPLSYLTIDSLLLLEPALLYLPNGGTIRLLHADRYDVSSLSEICLAIRHEHTLIRFIAVWDAVPPAELCNIVDEAIVPVNPDDDLMLKKIAALPHNVTASMSYDGKIPLSSLAEMLTSAGIRRFSVSPCNSSEVPSCLPQEYEALAKYMLRQRRQNKPCAAFAPFRLKTDSRGCVYPVRSGYLTPDERIHPAAVPGNAADCWSWQISEQDDSALERMRLTCAIALLPQS